MAGFAPVYLDNNATTAVSAAAREAMLPFLGAEHGNPSSLHDAGRRARAAVARARVQVAALAGAAPSEVVFTSGGTEADQLAILGALEAAGEERRHVVTTAVEHPAVRNLLRALRERGRIALTEVGVAKDGTLHSARLLAAAREGAALRARFEEGVLAGVRGARRSSAAAPRVPNTSNLLFPGAEGESLVLRLDALGIAVSTGSACTTGSTEASPVLLAMGIPKPEARGALRISLSRFTTEEEIERAAAAVIEVVRR